MQRVNSLPVEKFFMLFCCLLIFFKINFFENSFRNTIWMSNRLNPDQAPHFVRPDLGQICLQRLWADHTGRQWVQPTILLQCWRKYIFTMCTSIETHPMYRKFECTHFLKKKKTTFCQPPYSLPSFEIGQTNMNINYQINHFHSDRLFHK